MRKLIAALLITACIASMALAEDYTNPIQVYNAAGQVMDAADPFVMRYNGRYYLYTTGAEEIRCYSSDDLIHWNFEGHCTQNGDGRIAYAPEVFYWRGQFLMITSPHGNGHFILVSDSPTGPFRKATENFGFSIDGSLFAGDDGKLWMLFLQNSAISITEIDPATLTPVGLKFNTGATLNHWTEGPGLIRRCDYYFLTYTGNHYLSTGYRVAWASRKDDPIGRFDVAADNMLLINSVFGDDFTGLGHSANFYGPDLDSIYTSYHCHAPSGTGGFSRWYNLDRLLTNGGTMYSTGASNTAMPVPEKADVYGDVQGDAGSWTHTEAGWMAEVPAAQRFTQECNFALNGGVMAWRMGSVNGETVFVETDGETLSLRMGDYIVDAVPVPELGESGRLHALRIENTPDITYIYIDTMRLMTLEMLGVTADTIGALDREGVTYSFMAHTARALGDGDDAALKAIPGEFAAVHAIAETGTQHVDSGTMDALALELGEASYAVRIAADGSYCFDLTVRAADAGKSIAISAGDAVLETVIPPCPDKKAEWFTFTTKPVALTAGDQVLTLSSDGAAVLMIDSFAHSSTEERTWNLEKNDRKDIITLGNFNAKNGALQISANKKGYALIGDQGCTDYEMHVRFRLPKQGTGTAGFLMRATEVSVHDDQVVDSAFGYSIGVSIMGLNIRQINYGAGGIADFVSIKEWSGQEEGELILRVQGSLLEIFLPGNDEPIYSLNDATPYSHGLCGLYSTGKEFAVTELSVRPVKE